MRKLKTKSKSQKTFLVFAISLMGLVISLVLALNLYSLHNKTYKPDAISYETKLPEDVKNSVSPKNGPSEKPQQLRRIPILMYHYVEYIKDPQDKIRNSLTIPPSVFAAQMKTLKDAGYTFMFVSEIATALSGKSNLPDKPIAITFDDSLRDFYTDVYPILQKDNIKVTQYVITGFLENKNHLTHAQLEEIAKSPLIEVGAHTVDHTWLKGIASQSAHFEIFQSRKSLQDELALPISSFAYPYGAFDLQTLEMVKEAGYTNAVSTIPGIEQSEENKYFMYRLRPGWRTGPVLLKFLEQDHFKAF